MVFRRVTPEEARRNLAIASASGPNFTATADLYDTAGVTAPTEALQAAAALDRATARQQRNRVGLPNLGLGLASKALALSQVGRQERLQAQLDEITRPVRNEEERLARIRARAATRSSVANANKAEISLEIEARTQEDRIASVRASRLTQEEQLRTQQERTRGVTANADLGEFNLSEAQRLAPFETRRQEAAAATAEEGLTRSQVQTDTARVGFRRAQVGEERDRVGLANAQESLVANRQVRSDDLRVSALQLQKAEAQNSQRESVQAYANAYAESGMNAAQLIEAMATAPSAEEREAIMSLVDPLLAVSTARSKSDKAASDATKARIGVGKERNAARKTRLEADAAQYKTDLQKLVPVFAQNPDAALKASQGDPVEGLDGVPPALQYEAANLYLKTQQEFEKRENDLAQQEVALASGELEYSQDVEEDIAGSLVAADYLSGGAVIDELPDKGYGLQVAGKTRHIPKAKLLLMRDEFAVEAGTAAAEKAERAAVNAVQESRLLETEARVNALVQYTEAPLPQSATRKLEAVRLMQTTGEDPEQAKELLQEVLAEAAAAVEAPTVAQSNTINELATGRFVTDAAIVGSLERFHTLDSEAVADHFSTRPLAGATMDAIVQQAHKQRGWQERFGRSMISISREDVQQQAARTYVNAYGVDKDGVEDADKVRGTNQAIRAQTSPILINAITSGLAGSLTEITRDISNPELELELQRFVIQPMVNVDSQDKLEPLLKNMAILEKKYGVNLYAPLAAAARESGIAAALTIRQQMSGPSLGIIVPLAKAWGVNASSEIEDIPFAIGHRVADQLLTRQLNAYSSVHKVDAIRQVYEGAAVLAKAAGEVFPADGFAPFNDREEDRAELQRLSIDDSAYMFALDANLEAATGGGAIINPASSLPTEEQLDEARLDAQRFQIKRRLGQAADEATTVPNFGNPAINTFTGN